MVYKVVIFVGFDGWVVLYPVKKDLYKKKDGFCAC